MERDEKQAYEGLKIPEKERKYHYCVLYTNVLKQAGLNEVLKRTLPEGRGTVFYPCMECYRRDAGGKNEIRPIFPGYIFIRSDMGARELHGFIEKHRRSWRAFIREISLSARRAAGEDVFADAEMDDRADAESCRFSDLKEDEAAFLDFLLDADGSDGNFGKDITGKIESKYKDLPAEGLLKMSYGYQEGGKYIVMKGPLRAYADHIVNVNKHDKKAFLDFQVNGKTVRAGFDVRPKRYWFPDDKETPEILPDGTEVDLKALAKAMMK